MSGARLNVDLHVLELRFASARLIEPRAVEKLARSIERDGQIVPCIVGGVMTKAGNLAAAFLIDRLPQELPLPRAPLPASP
jgi:hypothetical protein